jgi:hypothetical protein
MSRDGRSTRYGALRQWRYPKELRIAAPEWGAGVAPALEDLAKALDQWGERVDPELLAQAATGLWRARRTMLERGSDRPLPDMRRSFRHVESAIDALATAGVQILDHTGDVYRGQELKVIAFEPRAGLDRERVAETVKPSVYLGGVCLQVGEVIVGTPEAADGPEPPPDQGEAEREEASR